MKRFFASLTILLVFALYAETLHEWFDGSQIGLFECHEGYETVRGAYDRFFFGKDETGKHLAWEFRRKTGDAPYNLELVFAPYGFMPAQRIMVEIRNTGETHASLQLRLGNYSEKEACGSKYWVWASPSQTVCNDGRWTTLIFDYDGHWNPSEPKLAPTLVGPINRLDIIALQNKPNVLNHLEIRRIYTQDACDPQLTRPFDLPAELPAGGTFAFPETIVGFGLQGHAPFEDRARLEFVPAEEIPGQIPVECLLKDRENILLPTTLEWRIPTQEVRLSRYFFNGRYRVLLHCGEGVVELGETTIANGVPRNGLTAFSVKEWQGAPTVFRENSVLPMVMKCTFVHGGANRGPQLFSDAGVELFSFDATPTENSSMLHSFCTNCAPGVYDYRQLDERIMGYLDVNPNALLMPRLTINAPQWWMQEHPEAQVVVEDADGSRRVLLYNYGKMVPSWASPEWQEYCRDSLRRMVAHIAAAPYASQVLGLFLCSGTTQEWMQWGNNERECPDYSLAAQKGFREYLREKYGTDENLRSAWHDAGASLDTASLPTRKERYATDPAHLDLRNPDCPADRKCVDYFQWNGEMTAGVIAGFSQAIKDASDNRMLTGAFYGYLLELCGSDRLVNSGHLGFAKLQQCTALDFLAAPTGYCFRQPGGAGICYQMAPAASLKLHNKFWWKEMDIRTHTTDAPSGYAGKADTLEEDFLQQDKEAVQSLCAGHGHWWLDVGYINFESPELMAHIKKLVGVMKEAFDRCDRTSEAQIAMILDEDSYAWGRVPSAPMVDNSTYQLPFLERVGATVEYYSSSDLENLPDRIRLVILATMAAPKPEMAKALERLRSDGRVILSFHAPGIFPSDSALTAEESLQKFSGFPIRLVNRVENDYARRVGDGTCFPKQTDGEVMAMTYWAPRKHALSPVPTVAEERLDARSHVIARYPNGDAAGAFRQADDHTDVFLALPYVDREFFRTLAQQAGVHFHVDTPDQVWATRGMVGICVKAAGDRVVHLKRACTVRDALTDEHFTTDARGDAVIPFAQGSTRLLLYEE